MELAAGTVVERYTIERTLGAGGMAVVYLARHNQIGTLHAVKVLTTHSPGLTERLMQEGRVQGGLRHPNIVGVTDVVRLDGAPGLVLEYIRGPSLQRLLAQRRPTLGQIDSLARGILRGMATAHRQGLVHRDIKPANILLAVGDDGLVAKVADFGLGKLVHRNPGSGQTRTGATMGTPQYMAPEQIRDSASVDARADVFALGALLFELVSGASPFAGSDTMDTFERICAGRVPNLDELAPAIPTRMSQTIQAALQVDPDQRPADAQQMLLRWTGQADGLAAEPLSDHPSLWDEATLQAAEALAPSGRESLASGDNSGPAPTPPAPDMDTFALSLDGGPTSSVAPHDEQAPGDSLAAEASGLAGIKWALWSALGAMPIFSIALVAVLGSFEAVAGVGIWLYVMFSLAIVGAGVTGWLAAEWCTGRARSHVPWLFFPAALVTLGHGGTIVGAKAAMALLDPNDPQLAHAMARAAGVALTADLVGSALAMLLLLVTVDVAAVAVWYEVESGQVKWNRRRSKIVIYSLVTGSVLWVPTMLWLATGAVPFAVFLLLLGAGAANALVAFERTDLGIRVGEHRILVALGSGFSVLLAAKLVFLQNLSNQLVEAGADPSLQGLAAAERFAHILDAQAVVLVMLWGLAAAVLAIISLKGDSRPQLDRIHVRNNLIGAVLMLLPVGVTGIYADHLLADLTGEIVPTVVMKEGQRWLGVPMTDRSLMTHRLTSSASVTPLLKVWTVLDGLRDRQPEELPDGALVIDDAQSLMSGDAIIAVDGIRVTSVRDLVFTLEQCDCGMLQDCKLDGECIHPESPLTLTVDRDGRITDVMTQVAGTPP